MKSIIEDIFMGTQNNVETINYGKAYREAQVKGCDLFEKLEKGLNEKQKKLLSKIFWADAEQEAEAIKTFYTEGFKAGFKIAVECLTE